jgi:hypothetical protein
MLKHIFLYLNDSNNFEILEKLKIIITIQLSYYILFEEFVVRHIKKLSKLNIVYTLMFNND